MPSLPSFRVRRAIVIGIHVVAVPIGFFAAFCLRWDFDVPAEQMELFWATLPLLLVARVAALAGFRLFQGWWRHVGVQDLVLLFKAVTLGQLLFMVGLVAAGLAPGFPRSILVLDWMIAFLMFSGGRFSVRLLREGRLWGGRGSGANRPTLILGAGNAAARLIHMVGAGDLQGLRPIGLLDDDPGKRGVHIHGVSVLGTIDDLPALVARHRPTLLVIAIPSATREQMQRVVEGCMATRVEFKVVPSLQELLEGRTRLNELRSVEIEDLLGRQPIRLHLEEVERDLEGRRVLITGGAGSIGSELARQVAAFGPSQLILLEQAESPLYFTHLELTKTFPYLEVVPVIADVADRVRLDSVFAAYRPDYVFHAAAYKHVPMMEANPEEAVRNNVLGTFNVARCAAEHGCAKFVLISTDKAVYPSSVMGATKRVAERVVLGWPSLEQADTDFRVVRFGNVLGSDGSVIPVFKRQLASGGPLTVTHPEVTRYFMTIPEAVQLVLQAAALPEAGGRIAMLDMGQPVRIVDLAEKLIRLSGLEPHKDVPIVFTGLRPGEKLHEELTSEWEATVGTSIAQVRVVEHEAEDSEAIARGIDRLAAAVTVGRRADLLTALRELVPESVAVLGDNAHGIINFRAIGRKRVEAA